MSEYVAPIRDMQFVMKELAGLEQVSQLPSFGDATDDLVDPELAPFVLTGRTRKRRFPAFLLVSLLTLLTVLAMAGPAWEKRETPTFRLQQSVVVGLDLSASMLAQDVAPNRMDQARFKLLDLLKLRRDGQTGLVVFAGDAFVVSPLTDDTRTIAAQAQNLGPDIMPVQGSRADLAIGKAVELLQQARSPQGGILLVTDGASDVGRARLAAADALKAGYTVSVLALGTDRGAPVPLANGSFLTDAGGRTVMPGLDEAALRTVASDGGGLYRKAQIGDADVQQLEAFWTSDMEGTELVSGQERQFDQWFNEGVWLVLVLVPFMALMFRRGWLAGVLCALVLQPLQPVQAAVWENLWQTPDQQGIAAFEAGDAAGAAQLFRDPDWKAAAAYKAGDYARALQLYADSRTVDGVYNYGNALARLGRYPEAIAAYEQVLAQQPDHEDARYNLELLKQKQQEQQQQQQQAGGQQNPEQGQPQQQAGDGSSRSQPQNNAAQQQQDAQQQAGQDEQQQQDQQAQQGEQQEPEREGEGQEAQPQEAQASAADREQQQATEQWLRRIPDDPAGLWRRKFYYQYQQRARQQTGEGW